MKKTYINPATNVIKVHAVKLLEGSTRNLGMGAEGSANEAESRRYRRQISVWDDDEEDY